MAYEERRVKELAPPRGILRAPAPDGVLEGRRVAPTKLGAHVHHFWWVRWSLRSPFVAEVLPHPSPQITYVDTGAQQRADLVGVHTGRLARSLTDEGETFGITFRPVMFQPLLGDAMATLTNRVVPLARVLGSTTKRWMQEIHAAPELDDRVAITERFLERLLPPICPRVASLNQLVERMAGDRTMRSSKDVSTACGLDARTLQRCFQTYVGVSPTSVIQRYRLHEAAIQLADPHPPTLAALAASLGYADQAHFSREFKRVIGRTPRSFSRSRDAT